MALPGVLDGEKLKAYNAQFQRSNQSPLAESNAPRVVVDGETTLHKYAAGASVDNMTGAEFYAIVGVVKRQFGAKGDALESDLMKISRQKDKKLRLMEWVGTNVRASMPQPSPAGAGMPPAGTPSKKPGMPALNLGSAFKEQAAAPEPQRPNTARPALAGDQMAALMGGDYAAPPLTARPATADGPPADMSVCMQGYLSGRDHLKMTGGEYYSIVNWLKYCGHKDLEDVLLKVRTLGDKKLHLVKYMKEQCADLVAPAPPQPAPPMPQPVQMGGAQVLQVPQPQMQPERDLDMPHPQMMQAAPPQALQAMQVVNQQQAAIMQAVAQIQQAGGMGGGSAAVGKSLGALETTLGRLEESFNFAVECMQTDMAECKKSLSELKLQLGV